MIAHMILIDEYNSPKCFKCFSIIEYSFYLSDKVDFRANDLHFMVRTETMVVR